MPNSGKGAMYLHQHGSHQSPTLAGVIHTRTNAAIAGHTIAPTTAVASTRATFAWPLKCLPH